MRASRTLRRVGILWVAMLVLGLVAAATASAASYTVIDLGTLGGKSSAANDINNRGDVVGWAATPSGAVHAFVYRDGKLIDIGTLGGRNSAATGISDNRAVVGTSGVAGGGPKHGFLWRANQGSPHNLGTPLPVHIGDTGAIIGNGVSSINESIATYRNQQGWIRLPLLNDDGSFGEDINNSGTAVGTLFTEPHGSTPFEYANGTLTVLPSVPLASETAAVAINDNGLIAGQTFDPLGLVLFDGTSWQPIPTPALFIPEIHDMNNCGDIVGAFHPVQFFKPSAFVITGGVGTDLNTLIPTGSGWHLGTATGINDSGEIAGIGRHNGVQHAFLLVPTTPESCSGP
jgi:probable HAF family extracellular repeat protein